MKKTHEDERLNALLGKRVRIKWWDGKADVGVLRRTETRKRYLLECGHPILTHTVVFYKSHVKKVEVL